jgi:radical SAM protein with 4Fe4S-binding SPASM domain
MYSNLADTLNYISKLSFGKVLNTLKVLVTFYWSKLTHSPIHAGMPVSISFEPTTSCNLRCPECPSGLRSFTRPTGMLQEQLFEKVIDELAPTLTYLTFYFQGEPYLNTQFLSMVSYANKKNIYTATSTNAHYLDDDKARQTVLSGLDRLIISIDGTTQETYEQYRVGGHIDKVIAGTKKIIEWKQKLKSATPHVIFQFLVVKPNEHQIDDVKKLAKSLGVDQVVFKTAQLYDYKHGSPLLPTKSEFARYQLLADGTYAIKNKLENHCWKMWHSCVITWDGSVVPCCFDKDAHHQLGNVMELSFKEVWKSVGYKSFRASLIRSRKEIDICKNCTEGTKVFG